MTFRDRWLRRSDDARRIKGDPPPTYAQLWADIREIRAALALAEQIAGNLRHQCDGLERENARLRLAGAEKSEYAEELALELAQAKRGRGGPIDLPLLAEREGLERITVDPDPARAYIKSPEATT